MATNNSAQKRGEFFRRRFKRTQKGEKEDTHRQLIIK
jgi:hypothetical protein